MGKAVGIDFGTKRIGFAISDSTEMIATPLATIKTHTVNEFISQLVSKEEISCFIVGFPINLNTHYTDSTSHVIGFIKRLKNQYPMIPVFEIDERFTSKIAKNAIANSVLKKQDRRNKQLIDKISATIILQDYLDKKV
tara:strand:+ start:317 stop:730 length:414 start_codon:yes stop_codon:yes gene_type:complete